MNDLFPTADSFDSPDYGLPWEEDTFSESPQSPCDDCDGCVVVCKHDLAPDSYDFYKLIDAMAHEIALLEEEVVRTRQVLAEYLPDDWSDGLRQDIFSNLAMRFEGDYEAYDHYLRDYRNGVDPLENPERTELMLRLRDGTDESTYYHLLPTDDWFNW